MLSREMRRQMERENERQPEVLTEWPPNAVAVSQNILKVWRNRHFLAQLYPSSGNADFRLSVNRVQVDGDRWKAEITWDELQSVKYQCGFGDWWAVEVYPAQRDVVNIANMRHLWLLREPPSFAWKNI